MNSVTDLSIIVSSSNVVTCFSKCLSSCCLSMAKKNMLWLIFYEIFFKVTICFDNFKTKQQWLNRAQLQNDAKVSICRRTANKSSQVVGSLTASSKATIVSLQWLQMSPQCLFFVSAITLSKASMFMSAMTFHDYDVLMILSSMGIIAWTITWSTFKSAMTRSFKWLGHWVF